MNIRNEKITATLAVLTLIVLKFLKLSTHTSQLLVWYFTQSGEASGGASAGTGAIVAAAIAKSSLTGLALLGAAAAGIGAVIAVG